MTNVPVTPDYILGPGDGFTMTVWGMVDGTYSFQVNREGQITLPKVGVVQVAGLPFGDLKRHLQRQMSRYFKDFNLDVTMGNLRTIRVYVVGEVTAPGSYTLSSLSTAFHALYAAGGPAKRGTLRDIRLIRNGTVVATIDLYKFLLSGDRSQDLRLQDQDTIFVPLIGPVVGIAGNVYRPAIYELKGQNTLGDVIALAGGILPTGYLNRVQVERIIAHEKKVAVDFDLSEDSKDLGKNERLQVPVQNMDVVKIFSIPLPTQDVVYLKGYVVRPGPYQFKPGMRVRDIIKSYEDLLPEPYPDYAHIVRYVKPDLHQIIVPFHLGRALKEDPEQNLRLETLDEITVYPKADFEVRRTVSITGEVQRPGSFPLLKGMRIKDLIMHAGNLTKEAYLEQGELLRMREDREVERFYFNMGKALEEDPRDNLLLQDEDQVVIHNLWEPKYRKQVAVSGLVNKPGEYRLTQSMRVADLLFTAGGLQKNAYLKAAELTRYTITQDGVRTTTITLDLGRALDGDPSQNLLLQDYDHLVVRPIPELALERTVILSGEVRLSGTYVIARGERLSSVLRRAGGFTDKAYLKGAIFTRQSVARLEKVQLSQFVSFQQQRLLAESSRLVSSGLLKDELVSEQQALGTRMELLQKLSSQVPLGRVVIKLDPLDQLEGSLHDIVLEDGDTLFVPQWPSSIAVLGSVHNPVAILYQEGAGIEYYIAQAGGLTRYADKKQVYVLKADGSAVASFLKIRALDPGDAIIVPPDTAPKVRPLPLWRDIATIIGQFAITVAALAAIL
ncbi:MAG: SLBB domain-containing protein [candidate division NC10 bacterium]|nr:SLBB domain-containing protein [candidate division NC10 bacterium]